MLLQNQKLMSLFSIIIPVYNKENHIQNTISSVLNQTNQDFEIIVVNDGSTDHSLDVIKSINDKRIKLFTIENKGVSHARNFGLTKASSEFIAFLDADDYWFPNHLETFLMLYNKFPNCGLYATAYTCKIGDLEIASEYYKIPKTPNWMGIVNDYFESSIINGIAWTSAVMIPKHIFSSIGNFDEDITLGAGEDTDLWMRIALKHSVAFSNTVTAYYMLDADNRITNSNTNLRHFLNLDQYEDEAKHNDSLKKYLDINRYAIAIQYKLVGNNKKASEYIKKLDFNNLNKKQRFLLYLNTPLLKLFMNLKVFLRNKGMFLSSFN